VRAVVFLLAPVLLALCLAAAPAAAPAETAPVQTVRAGDHDQFWLWAAVNPPSVLAGAHSLYILQGQVEAARRPGGGVRMIAQGGAPVRIDGRQVWLTYRVHTLDWPPAVYAQIGGRIARWRAAGTPIAGVQIDFDARTRHLDDYAVFLRALKQRLPPGCRLSVTGLLDWGGGRDPAALDALGGTVDEVVLQTYQGRRTIPNARAYLGQLDRLRFPFKLGLVEHGAWTEPAGLKANPWFRGYVVFLVNDPPAGPAATRRPSGVPAAN
jgi:hypothetical protein